MAQNVFTYLCFYISEICQMRLDFDTFVTVEATDVCTDSFEIVGPTDTNGLSNLCGKLTGQHGKLDSK